MPEILSRAFCVNYFLKIYMENFLTCYFSKTTPTPLEKSQNLYGKFFSSIDFLKYPYPYGQTLIFLDNGSERLILNRREK